MLSGAYVGPSNNIGSGAEVETGARTGAHVIIHPNAGIGTGAVIGDYTEIGHGLPIRPRLCVGPRGFITGLDQVVNVGPIGRHGTTLAVYPAKDGRLWCQIGGWDGPLDDLAKRVRDNEPARTVEEYRLAEAFARHQLDQRARP